MDAEAHLAALRDLPLPWGDPRFEAEARQVLALSEFAAGILRRYPEAVTARWRTGAMAESLAPWLADPDGADEASALRALRVSRHVGQLEILWRDVTGVAPVEATIGETSKLADALIGAALGYARQGLVRFGSPRAGDGRILDLIVFGLGKLGGHELNYSSDIDLVFAYAERGETDGRRSIDNEEYFRRLGTQLSRLLGHATEDGFCYRVDLRLRPYGTAGRVALSAAAMEQYFEREGRSWERYAWIKARPVAGDIAGGEAILATLRPFVYRRYLDFSAYDSLREMKAMIRAEVERRDLRDHVKLGSGGIREIEFFVQAFQLIRGGREPTLRSRSLIETLAALLALGEIGPDVHAQLGEAYRFLRRLENRFQQVADQQTHRPPEDGTVRDAIARSLDFEDWSALAARWQAHRVVVAACFDAVFEADAQAATTTEDPWATCWRNGGALPDEWRAPVDRFRSAGSIRLLSAKARQRLDRLMPMLFREVDELAERRDQVTALERVLSVIGAVARRSTYLAMMTEQPAVLRQLVALCARSSWVTDRLARHPAMLDELIDRRVAPSMRTAEDHLAHRLASAAGDLELEMEILREVRDSRAIHLAADLLADRCSAEEVSVALAETADAVLGAVYRLAWRDVTRRHGAPPGGGLAIIGYGTLGGRELSFDSDLDLVFLYGDGDAARPTDGDRPIDALTFYTRLSQRILHLVTTQTASGRLFEVDTRLRPNGRSGLLVTGVRAFRAYQEEKAWTWEIQALSRARFVAGDPEVGRAFDDIRAAVVGRSRDPASLAADVVEMREKMRAGLDRRPEDGFDLKHGRGGRVDLEFVTQYARLRWASDDPALASTRGTVSGLRALARAGRLASGEAETLTAAYERFRRVALEAALGDGVTLLPAGALAAERAAVAALWERLLGTVGGVSSR